MAKACKEELEKHGVVVRMSRSTDENDPVADEVKECNAFKPDIAIDIHNNAGGGDGFEVYYWSDSKEGLNLARLVEREVNDIGQNSRGVKVGNELRFVNGTKCVAILTEGFFLDNATDRKVADAITEQQAFGKAYARGILKYFGITPLINKELYRVQIGAFNSKTNADKLAEDLKAKGYPAYVTKS